MLFSTSAPYDESYGNCDNSLRTKKFKNVLISAKMSTRKTGKDTNEQTRPLLSTGTSANTGGVSSQEGSGLGRFLALTAKLTAKGENQLVFCCRFCERACKQEWPRRLSPDLRRTIFLLSHQSVPSGRLDSACLLLSAGLAVRMLLL
jgi:hypothetical protein